MVRSRILIPNDNTEQAQPSSQSSQEEMLELFEEALQLLNNSQLNAKNYKIIKKQLLKYAPDGYKAQKK